MVDERTDEQPDGQSDEQRTGEVDPTAVTTGDQPDVAEDAATPEAAAPEVAESADVVETPEAPEEPAPAAAETPAEPVPAAATPAPATTAPATTRPVDPAPPAASTPEVAAPTSLTRELILPAVRLDVPDRPSADQVTAMAARGPDDWTSTPLDRVTRQVVRLAVARVLTARVTQPGPGAVQHGAEGGPGRAALSTDPAEVTLRQAAGLFRPHVDLATQAFRLAVVEAVNAGVPAATDPVREGLRRLGVTGRDPVRMVALGLDRVPARGRSAFWSALSGSATVTSFVADLAAAGSGASGGSGSGKGGGGGKARTRDVSSLDRSLLARADALVLAGGRTTPVVLGGRAGESGGWLQVPLVVGRRRSGPGGFGGPGGAGRDQPSQQGGRPVVEVGLRGAGWVEVVETTLSAVSAAMTEIDLGSRPRSLRLQGLAEALATRLVAAADRTVADVCASLRDVDADVLEVFDARVSTTAVPVAVPVPEEEQLAQLWLPGSALAAPLFTAAVDLYLGEGSEVRAPGGRPPGARSGGGAGPGGAPRAGSPGPRPRAPEDPAAAPGQPGQPGSRSGRSRRGGRGRRRTEGSTPDAGGGTAAPSAEGPAPTPPAEPGA